MPAIVSKTDGWSSLAATAPPPSAKVAPSQVPTAGIAPPMKGFGGAAETGFRVAYGPTKDPVHDRIRQAFQQEQVFEKIATELNATLRLSRTVDIHLAECNTVNAFYDPQHSRIIMCHEMVAHLVGVFRGNAKSEAELGRAVLGATLFIFFHELGHALVHQLEIPVTGREEDAVDQLATLILMEGGDEGIGAVLAGAQTFMAEADQLEKQSAGQLNYAGEHSLGPQRFYSIACLVYGSNPERWAGMVSQNILPQPRAVRCPAEYQQTSKAWTRLVDPHLKQRGAAAATTRAPNADAPSPTPVSADTSCAAVARHVARLAESQDPALEATLSSGLQQACESQRWSAEARACMATARTADDLGKCEGEATDDAAHTADWE